MQSCRVLSEGVNKSLKGLQETGLLAIRTTVMLHVVKFSTLLVTYSPALVGITSPIKLWNRIWYIPNFYITAVNPPRSRKSRPMDNHTSG